MHLRTIMNAHPVCVRPEYTAALAARILNEHDVSDAPVLDANDRVVGIITNSLLLHVVCHNLPCETPVKSLMLTEFRTGCPDDEVSMFCNLQQQGLPVVEGDHMVGYLTRSELTKILESIWARAYEDVQAMYNPVISIDVNGNVRAFNRALEKVLNLRPEEIRGRNIMDLFANSRLPSVVETGETQSTQKLMVAGRTLLSNRTPIVNNGKVVGAVAVLQDISELEEISQELESTKRLVSELNAIIESSFDGLYVTDGTGLTLRVNQGFCRITGVPAEECIGRNMAELVETGVYSRSGSLLALERRERVTITLRARTGKWVLVTSNPIFDENGDIILVVTNVRDVTELNDLERRLEQAEGLKQFYKTELQQLKLESSRQIVTRSPRMLELINLVIRLAGVDSTILLQGESGVGKELIADIIHANSRRKNSPFIKVNCGAIPENLLEAELFGYEPGAFTGAVKSGKIGFFELASGGTIFLDEIAELPVNLQVKLLRVLQERQIIRVGGTTPVHVDIRVVAGTNRNLEEMIKVKQFREDLYYRLHVVPIHVPPLRERKEDIPVLAQHFLAMFNRKYQMNKRISQEVIHCLMEYDWPGNVRELENLIERLVVTSLDNVIDTDQLPSFLHTLAPGSGPEMEMMPLKDAVENLEKQLLRHAFARYRSSYKVAQVLKVNQSTVIRKAAKYGIKPLVPS